MEREQIVGKLETVTLIKKWQIVSVMELTDEGCTIPFIARYRKEKTGDLDEVAVSQILELYEKVEELEKRREYILDFLGESEKLTDDLGKRLRSAETMTELEDLYLPYKPRRKTLADKAVEMGLQPLADLIKSRNLSTAAALSEGENFVSDEVTDPEKAVEGALNIVVQEISDSAEVRQFVRDEIRFGKVVSSVKRGKKEEGAKYQDYYEFTESVVKIASHRVMAILRGEKEEFLSVSAVTTMEKEELVKRITRLHFGKSGELLNSASEDSLKRHLQKSLGNEIVKELQERAEMDSVDIFRKNLEKILFFSPFGERGVIGIDPGIRTGCKAVVLDEKGELRDYSTLFLNRKPEEAEKLLLWAEKYNIKAVAIGDGTFGRETHAIVKKLFKGRDIVVTLVDEDGASIYSASEAAREEFPDLDLTVRGAVSIGRRFQDPMAELVKIDPKSLGVGQYQHDVNPKLMKEKLTQTVGWAVNKVGVNLNTASYHLLGFISGLDRKKAKEIVKYRSENKRFLKRSELKKVKGVGAKAFEQSAGFLRIKDGPNILDSTGVHPASYGDVEKIASFLGKSVKDLVENPGEISSGKIRSSLDIAELDSIISELKQKGLDPRDEYKEVAFREDIESIGDLTEGMVLTGVVDNVVAFGAFVDIGIKEKGLVHVSEVADRFIKDVNAELAVGDEVRVKVVSIDSGRKRIGLSIKQAL